MAEEEFERAVGRLLARLVAVEDEHDAVGQAAEGLDVVVGQGRAEGPHDVRQARPGARR